MALKTKDFGKAKVALPLPYLLVLQKESSKAALVFHAASFYPLALLAVVAVRILAARSA